MTTPSEAAQQLDLVTAEIARLRENFSMRPKPEKARMGALEKLAPKLHRLAKGTKTELTEADTKTIASLVPASKKA